MRLINYIHAHLFKSTIASVKLLTEHATFDNYSFARSLISAKNTNAECERLSYRKKISIGAILSSHRKRIKYDYLLDQLSSIYFGDARKPDQRRQVFPSSFSSSYA